jgi:hypothetical protein
MANYKRTAIERETIINYNNEEDTANVYTWHKSLINKLSNLLDERDDIQCKYTDEECASFVVPKSWIKVSPPKTRNLTDEQRAKAAERLRKAREAKNV